MKILFFSDIHGSLPVARTLDAVVRAEQPDLIALLGDLLYHGPRNPLPEGYAPRAAAEIINGWKNLAVAVRGNCDSEVDQMLLELPVRADCTTIFADGLRLHCTHGHLYNHKDVPHFLPPGTVLVFGHTHVPLAETRGDLHVWNCGSPSLPKDGHPASYGIYQDRTWRVVTLNGETHLSQTL